MSETVPAPNRFPKRFVVLAWALTAIFLCYVDRVIISLAAIDMQAELSWSDTSKGVILSSFFLGYLIMQPLGGILANRFGGRNVFLCAVMGWSLFTILTPIAARMSFDSLIVTRFLVGFGEGAAFPAVYNLISNWMRKDETSSSIGFMTASSSAGTLFAFLVAGKIISIYGWPSVFYLFGGLGILWSIIWVWVVPSRAILAEDRVVEGEDHEKSPTPWRLILIHPSSLGMYLIGMAGALMSFTLVTWMPSYYSDTFGMDTAEAGLASLVPFAAFMLTTMAAGVLGDRLVRNGVNSLRVRKGLTIAGFSMGILCLIAVTQVGGQLIAVLLLSLSLGGLGVAAPGYSVIPSELFPRHGDILYGFMAGFATLCSVPTIALTGVILDRTGSYDQMFFLIVIGTLVGLITFALLARNDALHE